MSILTISDLHLALGIDKPMDIFGDGWKNYMERLKENWNLTVSDSDTVVIGGDISWATYLDEVYRDFEYIEKLYKECTPIYCANFIYEKFKEMMREK